MSSTERYDDEDAIAPPGTDTDNVETETSNFEQESYRESPFEKAFKKLSKDRISEKYHQKITHAQAHSGNKRPLTGFTIGTVANNLLRPENEK